MYLHLSIFLFQFHRIRVKGSMPPSCGGLKPELDFTISSSWRRISLSTKCVESRSEYLQRPVLSLSTITITSCQKYVNVLFSSREHVEKIRTRKTKKKKRCLRSWCKLGIWSVKKDLLDNVDTFLTTRYVRNGFINLRPVQSEPRCSYKLVRCINKTGQQVTLTGWVHCATGRPGASHIHDLIIVTRSTLGTDSPKSSKTTDVIYGEEVYSGLEDQRSFTAEGYKPCVWHFIVARFSKWARLVRCGTQSSI